MFVDFHIREGIDGDITGQVEESSVGCFEVHLEAAGYRLTIVVIEVAALFNGVIDGRKYRRSRLEVVFGYVLGDPFDGEVAGARR